MPKSTTPLLAAFAVQIKRTGDDGAIPELHLLPDGEFKPQAAEDAREMPKSGTYRMNAQIAEKVIALARASVNDLPIDYEHQTQQAATNGQPAPAAGGWRAQSSSSALAKASLPRECSGPRAPSRCWTTMNTATKAPHSSITPKPVTCWPLLALRSPTVLPWTG